MAGRHSVPPPRSTVVEEDGNAYLGRWTYGNTRAWLGNGPGANAIWNITNVNRSDRRYLYATKEWVAKMEEMGLPVDGFDVAPGATNSLEAEMDNDDYQAFMVWHRGLAIPAARNLDQPEVQRGREVFTSWAARLATARRGPRAMPPTRCAAFPGSKVKRESNWLKNLPIKPSGPTRTS